MLITFMYYKIVISCSFFLLTSYKLSSTHVIITFVRHIYKKLTRKSNYIKKRQKNRVFHLFMLKIRYSRPCYLFYDYSHDTNSINLDRMQKLYSPKFMCNVIIACKIYNGFFSVFKPKVDFENFCAVEIYLN